MCVFTIHSDPPIHPPTHPHTNYTFDDIPSSLRVRSCDFAGKYLAISNYSCQSTLCLFDFVSFSAVTLPHPTTPSHLYPLISNTVPNSLKLSVFHHQHHYTHSSVTTTTIPHHFHQPPIHTHNTITTNLSLLASPPLSPPHQTDLTITKDSLKLLPFTTSYPTCRKSQNLYQTR